VPSQLDAARRALIGWAARRIVTTGHRITTEAAIRMTLTGRGTGTATGKGTGTGARTGMPAKTSGTAGAQRTVSGGATGNTGRRGAMSVKRISGETGRILQHTWYLEHARRHQAGRMHAEAAERTCVARRQLANVVEVLGLPCVTLCQHHIAGTRRAASVKKGMIVSAIEQSTTAGQESLRQTRMGTKGGLQRTQTGGQLTARSAMALPPMLLQQLRDGQSALAMPPA